MKYKRNKKKHEIKLVIFYTKNIKKALYTKNVLVEYFQVIFSKKNLQLIFLN